MLSQHSNKATGYNGGYIQNKNKYLNGLKFGYESRSYFVTKATQNLGHIGWTPNE